MKHPLSETPEEAIQRKLAFIHALARHLLRVNDIGARELFVGVQPLGNAWRVQVSFAGFLLERKALDLSDALEQVLQHLTEAVSQNLEEGMKLLGVATEEAKRKIET